MQDFPPYEPLDTGDSAPQSQGQLRRAYKRQINKAARGLFGFFAMLQLVTPILIAIAFGARPGTVQSILDNGLFMSALCLLSLVLFVLPVRQLRTLWSDIWDERERMRGGQLWRYSCAAFSMQGLFLALAAILLTLLPSIGKQLDAISEFSSDPSMMLYVALVGPIVEELVFRGMLQRALEPHGKWLAVLASSLLFALYHGNILQGVFAFAIGLVLGYVAMRHSLQWSILLHILNNFVFADLPRILAPVWGEASVGVVKMLMVLMFSVLGLGVFIRKRRAILGFIRANRIEKPRLCWTFGQHWILLFTIVCSLLVLYTSWAFGAA